MLDIELARGIQLQLEPISDNWNLANPAWCKSELPDAHRGEDARVCQQWQIEINDYRSDLASEDRIRLISPD